MKSEEKIPWKCSLKLCHSKASFKKGTAHARKITIYFSSIFPGLGIPDSTAGRNEVSPLTELLKKLL